jgi:PEP-CTERM motif-containing protein
MSLSRQILCRWLLGLFLVLTGPAASAGQVWTVSLDTSKLATDYTAPFGLDFELVGSNGNTVTVGDFSFGSGGSAGPGPAFLTGGASGALTSSVSLSDSINFFSDFNQQFTPGSMLKFTVDSTLVAPPSGGTPDNFSMVIFSAYDPVNGYSPLAGTGGTPIPTTDPSGNNTFFNFDVTGPGTTTASSYPSSSGDVTITVTQASVPEPSTVMLMLFGILGLLGAVCWRSGD